jgi:hypothetical protein
MGRREREASQTPGAVLMLLLLRVLTSGRGMKSSDTSGTVICAGALSEGLRL